MVLRRAKKSMHGGQIVEMFITPSKDWLEIVRNEFNSIDRRGNKLRCAFTLGTLASVKSAL
jgi:hypothetical protein